MAGSRLALGGREADLRVTGRSLARHAFDKAAAGVATATLPLLAAAAAASGGVSVPLPLVALAAAGGAVAGFAVPDFTLKEEAARRRQEFRFALASYLELVVVVVAAGGGTETALFDAASAGEGWVYDELRSALGPCRLTGEAPWDALAALGRELGVPQLVELAATITLAGEHGAKVRDSLRAKAQSLRHHQQSEVLAEAESATEKMAVPVVELLFAFLLFVAYPAVARIVTGL
jgi:Flp pilus assembly protein TadB